MPAWFENDSVFVLLRLRNRGQSVTTEEAFPINFALAAYERNGETYYCERSLKFKHMFGHSSRFQTEHVRRIKNEWKCHSRIQRVTNFQPAKASQCNRDLYYEMYFLFTKSTIFRKQRIGIPKYYNYLRSQSKPKLLLWQTWKATNI